MDTAAELGKNPVSKHQIQPEYGDEQADAGRNCRTRLVRPNYQARTGTGKKLFSLFSRIGNLTRLILTLAICDDNRRRIYGYLSHTTLKVRNISVFNSKTRGRFCPRVTEGRGEVEGTVSKQPLPRTAMRIVFQKEPNAHGVF